MHAINHVELVGRIVAPPEAIKPSSAGRRLTFLVETERETTADGEPRHVLDFHRVIVAGPLVAKCKAHLEVDAEVRIEGSLVNRGFVKNGEKRFITEIHADLVDVAPAS